MRNISITTLSVAAFLAVCACNTPTMTVKSLPNLNNQQVAATTTTDDVSSALTGDWAVINIKGDAISAEANDFPYVGFQQDSETPGMMRIYAYDGCNFINGVVSLNGGQVTPQGDYAATMKYCPDATYALQMASCLEQFKSLKIERINNESFLYLRDAAGETLMTLRKHNLNFLEGAWQVTRVDGNKLARNVSLQVVIDMQNLSIHGNAGCNTVNGKVTINMEQENGVGFSNLATTRMTCPDIDLEKAFLVALEQVTVAVPGDNNDTAILKNAAGEPIIELHRLSRDQL